MYKSALKNGFGSLVPDFPPNQLIGKKEFDNCMMGQTIHQLSRQELNELKLSAGIYKALKIDKKTIFNAKQHQK